jgi:Flp pilus assembly protein TadG
MNFNSEKGQALILTTFAIIALIGFTALALDGGRAFEERRHAQNAADTAALAGALAYQQGVDITTSAQTRATSNGYDDNGTTNDVTIAVTDIAAGSGVCPGDAAGKEITVDITTNTNTTFTRVLGRNTLSNTVSATSRACLPTVADPFNGAAVAGLNPGTSSCAYDSGNSNAAHWTVKGGGIFSNGCAYSKNNGSVTIDSGECVATVGSASNFTCMQPNQTSMALSSANITEMMPPNPCTAGGIGITPASGQTTFTNGVYCISNLDALDKKDIVLNNATLYVTDLDFDLKFAGGGGFNGSPTVSGTYAGSDTYAGYYMIIAYNPSKPCTAFNAHGVQTMQLRGNSGGTFSGTILAPSACLDIRGNGEPSGIHTQIIGWMVSSNGNAEVYINYNPNPDLLTPYDPTITLER